MNAEDLLEQMHYLHFMVRMGHLTGDQANDIWNRLTVVQGSSFQRPADDPHFVWQEGDVQWATMQTAG